MSDRVLFNCIVVQNRIVENHTRKGVAVLKRGDVYGHGFHALTNLSLWPYELDVTNTLDDTKQIGYFELGRTRPDWSFSLTLHPDRSSHEALHLLQCSSRNVRDRDRIVTEIRTNAGSQDTIVLEVEISDP